jgi:hypothetical protein
MRRADWLATEGTVANVLSFYARGRKSYDVTFSYIVDGHVYQSTRKMLNACIGESSPYCYSECSPFGCGCGLNNRS